jgi:hypothetical protein
MLCASANHFTASFWCLQTLALRESKEFPRWMQIPRARRTIRGQSCYSDEVAKEKLDDVFME